jgi:hypothetical protein
VENELGEAHSDLRLRNCGADVSSTAAWGSTPTTRYQKIKKEAELDLEKPGYNTSKVYHGSSDQAMS